MKKITIALISLFVLQNYTLIAQNDNPMLNKLLNQNEYSYLKDFEINLEPGVAETFSVVLSKNTIYSLSVFQEEKNQFSIELLNTSSKNSSGKDMVESLSKIQINDKSLNLEYTIKNTGVYNISVKNNSTKKASTVVLLSFVNRIIDEEVIAITAKKQPQNQKEKDVLKVKEEESEEIFFIVEQMPKFKGKSSDEFKKFLNDEIRYPQEALEQKIEGKLFVQFTVDKEGYVKDAKVVRGIHPALDQEALRIVYSSPRWEPGTQRGKAVNVIFTFPVIFQLIK